MHDKYPPADPLEVAMEMEPKDHPTLRRDHRHSDMELGGCNHSKAQLVLAPDRAADRLVDLDSSW